MSIVAWIVLGLISGFIASKIVNKTGEGIVLDIILGVVALILQLNQIGSILSIVAGVIGLVASEGGP